MKTNAKAKPVVFSVDAGSINRSDEYIRPTEHSQYSTLRVEDWHRFGNDNLFPQALAYLNRKSPVHRGIINSRTRYVTGSGFNTDDGNMELYNYLESVNAHDETMQKVVKKVVFDKVSSGNGYLEIVTNRKGQFLNFYHRDYTTARVGKKKYEGYILLHPNWAKVEQDKEAIKAVPVYPNFEDTEGDGNLRAIIHIKGYEPEFSVYGIPDWIAGMGVSAIAYKTDKWNISRLDNSFNSSGVFLVDGDFNTDEEAEELKAEIKKQYTGEGNTGKVVFIAKNLGEGGSTSFTPFTNSNDGDWSQLHQQSTSDLIIAHCWFRSLAGIADNTGFDTDRILNEWQVAINTVIPEQQNDILEPIKKVLEDLGGFKTDDLVIINKPPVSKKPGYMFIWEARKADGLDYDDADPLQLEFVANIGRNSKPQTNGQ